jgi:hypothetical protein
MPLKVIPFQEHNAVRTFNKLSSYLFLSVTLTSFSHTAYATCSRSDVEFYLNKGFSTDQITKLCTAAPPVQGKTENTLSVDTDTAPDTSNNTELFLREAIKGRDIVLTHESLSYTLKTCVHYGEEDGYGFTPKACPYIRFNVSLKDLQVTEPGNKYLFFNPDEVDIEGDITRKILSGLKKHSPEDKKLIIKALKSGNKTSIPVRDDISLEKVFEVLKQISI